MDTIKLPLLPLGDPLLRMRSLPVRNPADPSVRTDASLLLDIFRAFRRNYGFGQGIAAPQIGLLKRIIVIDPGSGGQKVMLDPEITWSSRQIVRQWESCMCFPSLLVMTGRAAAVRVVYQTLDGALAEWNVNDTECSAVIQHEVDHLDGILILDRAIEKRWIISREAYDRNPGYFWDLCSTPQQPE